ncbi:MAG TPA: alanine--tRNA ligase [Thermoanaerobaculia bacterium]|nr:alanine--tRNA ligase [Thermoanaerobaculia bacterium]
MDSREVRERFLRYFEDRGHRRVPSSALIPAGDPTLLFANAGMNQFKDVFTGREKRDYVRATSAQKCVRAGGKHNDLDNVGYTARHQTFFEMLGNFSFGDYFKEDAIRFAWELLTDSRVGYGLEVERLWFTVYTTDDEAARLWEKAGARPDRILRFGEKDNFWAMGETGPCGPCSEIHYYRGDDPADPAKNRADLVNGPGDETMEIWNLVFMQYERDESGTMTPLPKPSVDTGAGLERIASILQGVNNNFDTDLFRPILGRVEEISGRRYRGGMEVDDAPFRVIADHARAATMLLADGVVASNEGRGYVLRRIIRRAIRYARRLGVERPILCDLVPVVIEGFEGIYFDAAAGALRTRIPGELRAEEELFGRTLTSGIDRIGEEIEAIRRTGGSELGGETAFRLYDTYGIPLDLISDIAQDEGLQIDVDGFEKAMDAQRARSHASARFQTAGAKVFETLPLPDGHSEFRGYPEQDFVRLPGARVLAIVEDREPSGRLSAGESGDVITDRTVFYPEGGGQVGDVGTWRWPGGSAEVTDVRRPVPGMIAHRVEVKEGELSIGETVEMEVDEWTRRRTQANHTGTHLLHAALRNVLGESARQMGSLVAPDRLRFDYAARSALTPAQIREIEEQVNREVLLDKPVAKEVVSRDEANTKGAIAFFGEKYGERVRVVTVPGYSVELCGGCHVPSTGEIGGFKILSDKGLAAGVRRIEAVTSLGTVELLRTDEEILSALSQQAKSEREKLPDVFRAAEERIRALEKDLAAARLKLAASGGSASAAGDDGVREVAGVRVWTREARGLAPGELRNLSDTLKGKLKSGVVAVGGGQEGKTAVIVAVTPDLTDRLSAADIAARIGPALGGRGGGKRDLAQVGGRDESLLPAGLAAAVSAVEELLAGS